MPLNKPQKLTAERLAEIEQINLKHGLRAINELLSHIAALEKDISELKALDEVCDPDRHNALIALGEAKGILDRAQLRTENERFRSALEEISLDLDPSGRSKLMPSETAKIAVKALQRTQSIPEAIAEPKCCCWAWDHPPCPVQIRSPLCERRITKMPADMTGTCKNCDTVVDWNYHEDNTQCIDNLKTQILDLHEQLKQGGEAVRDFVDKALGELCSCGRKNYCMWCEETDHLNDLFGVKQYD